MVEENKQDIKGLWDYKNEKWEVLYINPETIKGVSKYNARQEDPDKDLAEIVTSMRETGINTRPIILDELDEVIEGGRRYKASLAAKLEKIWCLKKAMSEREKMIRSFIENELHFPMTGKDRYLFAKALYDAGMSVQNIALVVGRAPGTVNEWLGYNVLPNTIKGTEAEQTFKDLPMRKKMMLRTTLDNPIFKKDPEAAVKITLAAPETKSRVIEDLRTDVKRGALDVNTSKKVEQMIEKQESIQKYPNKYDMRHLRLPIDLYGRLVQIFKFDYPDVSFDEGIIRILDEYSNKRQKELGLMV